jgi:hypothetical protein
MTSISAITSVVSSTTTTMNRIPAPKPAEYSITELVLAFFKEKVKDLAKIGSYLAFWTIEAIPNLPPNVTKFSFMMRDFKNFISATEVPEKLYTLGGSLNNFVCSKLAGKTLKGFGTWEEVGTASRKVFKDTLDLIRSTADSIDFAHLFIPISKETLKWVSGISLAATIGFSGNSVIEQMQNINGMNNIDPNRTNFYLINLARDVSFIAFGVISLTSLLTATSVAPWVLVACLTSGLTFSIGGYFYERIVDPENKGKNINPAVAVENYVNQRNVQP